MRSKGLLPCLLSPTTRSGRSIEPASSPPHARAWAQGASALLVGISLVGLLLAGSVVWMVVAWMLGIAAVLAHDVYKRRRIKR
jgi:hypothetical protein